MAARRVLVIEDEAGARDALGRLLAEEGYAVRTASSGETGLDSVREFHPDTVVCDFYLPDIDGLEVVRRLRSMSDPVYIIVLTAACGGGEAERALRAEADLFLTKPVDLGRLQSVLRNAAPAGPEPMSPMNAIN